jgi:hypothetical protein
VPIGPLCVSTVVAVAAPAGVAVVVAPAGGAVVLALPDFELLAQPARISAAAAPSIASFTGLIRVRYSGTNTTVISFSHCLGGVRAFRVRAYSLTRRMGLHGSRSRTPMYQMVMINPS